MAFEIGGTVGFASVIDVEQQTHFRNDGVLWECVLLCVLHTINK